MTHYIYCITNLVNNKSYVGQAVNVKVRWNSHKNYSNKIDNENGKKRLFAIHAALKKYGIDNFKFEVIDQFATIDEANEAEMFYIEYLGTLARNGYNLHPGGNNHTMLQETKDRIALAKSNINPEIARSIYISCMEGGMVAKNAIIEASIKYDLSRGSIYQILNKNFWKNATKDLPSMKDINRMPPQSIFTREQILDMRKEYSDFLLTNEFKNKFYREYAKKYNVSEICIEKIVKGTRYVNIC